MFDQAILYIQEHPEVMVVVALIFSVCVLFLFRKAVIEWARRLKF